MVNFVKHTHSSSWSIFQDTPSIPEDLGREVAMRLLDEIYRGGCCDSAYQWLAALYMALGQKHVSKFLTGKSKSECNMISTGSNSKLLRRPVHVHRVLPAASARLFLHHIQTGES